MINRTVRQIIVLVSAVLLALVVGGSASAAPTQQQDPRFNTPVVIVNTSFLNVRTGPGVEYTVLITVVGGTTLPVIGIAPDGVWFQVSTQAGVGWMNSQYGLPRGNFQFVPRVQPPVVTAPSVQPPSFTGGAGAAEDNAADVGFSTGRAWGVSVVVAHDMRSAPGLDDGRSIGPAPVNNTVYNVANAVTVDGIVWIQINVTGLGLGWVEQSKVLFRPIGCGFSSVIMTQDRDLAVGPDGSGGNGSISAGQEAYLLDETGELFKIELINGLVGWVDRSSVLIRDETEVVTPSCVSAANIGGGSSEEGTGSAPGVTVPTLGGAHVVVNTGFLNIRSGAGAQFSTVASVPGGTKLPAVGFAPDGVWILVSGSFGRGWVNSDFVLFRGNASSLPVIRDTIGETALPTASITRTVTLYAAPNLTLGVVGTLNAPATATVIGRTADSLWVQLTTPIGIGWVQADFVVLQGNLAQIPTINN
jgi:uncharacterized protein YgiM (DUF1202 family)